MDLSLLNVNKAVSEEENKRAIETIQFIVIRLGDEQIGRAHV